MKKKTLRKTTKPEEPALPRGSVRKFPLGEGMGHLSNIQEELLDMTDVLMGRVSPPAKLRGSTLALMEVADAYYARASEIKMRIHRMEREGRVSRGSALYAFRTGELATFMEMCKRSADLGSRRLTDEQMTREAERTGREYE